MMFATALMSYLAVASNKPAALLYSTNFSQPIRVNIDKIHTSTKIRYCFLCPVLKFIVVNCFH